MSRKRLMKRERLMGIMVLIIAALFFRHYAFADLPQQVFFQAKISNKNGSAASGSHSCIFRLYSASTGGSALWKETQSVTADSDGIVSVYLGGTTALSGVDFNSTYYLSIEVDSDGEMSPRIKVVPSLAALNADRFDGLNSTQFLRSDTASTMSAAFTATSSVYLAASSGNVGIGTTAPLALLQVGTAPGPGLFVTGAGNVGIGTTNPAQKLEVSGTVKATTFDGAMSTSGDIVSSGNLQISGAGPHYISAGNVGIGTTAPLALLQVGTAPGPGLFVTGAGNVGIGTTNPIALLQVGTSPNAPLVVLAGGNIGIGTTNPLQKLQIAGDVNIESGSGIRINNTATSGQYLRGDGTRFVSSALQAGDLPAAAAGWTDDGTVVRLTTSTDNVGIGTTAPLALLQVGTAPGPGLFVTGAGNVGIGTTNPIALLQVGTSPSAPLVVLAAGKVGIGTTNPAAGLAIGTGSNANATTVNDLYVTGNLEVDGTLYGTISSGTGTFTGLTVTGNTTLGDASGDTLTVNATPTFQDVNVTFDLPASGYIALAENITATTSPGAIRLGRSTDGWESISFDPSLGSNGKFVFTAPLQVAASSPAIIFYDPTAPSDTNKQRSIDYDPTNLQLQVGDSFKTNFSTSTGAPPASKAFFQIGPNAIDSPASQGIFIGANPPANFTGDLLHFQVGNATRFRVTKFGDIISGGATMTANGPILNTTQTWNNAAVAFTAWQMNITDTASLAASKFLDMQAGGASKFVVEKSGNTGIGTGAPGSALDVKGTLRLSGSTSGYVGLAPAAAAGSATYTLPSADGASGQALTTNGSGALSWTTIGGANISAGDSNVTVTDAGDGYVTFTEDNGEKMRITGGNVGVGTSAPAHKLDVSGAMYSRRFALTDGATIAVDWNNGNVQSVTLGGNRTFTFANGQDGAKYILIIKQDATGSRTVTWPASVRWKGGNAVRLTTTASQTDYIGFIYNGVDSKYDVVATRLNF